MGKICVLLICIFMVVTMQAQQKLSKEEKARRDKNVEAANPFAKFGSKAKVATLSKGKYPEVQDLDSIVTIGSVRFNVNTNKIVGFVERDSISGDAQPVGDVPSRWVSHDPLSEEFSNWSPYNFGKDNPIIFLDPDGRAADDWRNTKGQQVYDPKANGGKGAYTKYATAQDRQFGDGLRNSGERGASRFNSLVNSAAKIQVEFHQEDSGAGYGYLFGETTYGENNTGYNVSAEGDIQLNSAKINVYIGTAERFVNDVKNGTADLGGSPPIQTDDAKIVKNYSLTAKDVATAIFGHEIDHIAPDNIKQQRQDLAKSTDKAEITPRITNNTILRDLAKQKK